MTVLVGIASTSDLDLDGYVIAPGAIPLTPLPPLLHEHHGAPVGKVIHLAYHDGRLLARAETDYPAAIGASHFSVNLRGATRKREGNATVVTAARLVEISTTRHPRNAACWIIERLEHDPEAALAAIRAEFFTLMAARVGLTQRLPLLSLRCSAAPEGEGFGVKS